MTVLEGTATVLVEHDAASRVATVTLNRPEKRNALSLALMGELIEVLRELGESCSPGRGRSSAPATTSAR